MAVFSQKSPIFSIFEDLLMSATASLWKAAFESMQTHKRKTMQKTDVENAVLSEVKYTFLDGLENLYIY